MVFNRFLFVLFLGFACNVYGQDDGFCDALTTIARDAPHKFHNVRGNTINDNMNVTTWACSIKIPGTISSRFVASMGLFYEGALFQSKSKAELWAAYDKYKSLLGSCLSPLGYELSLSPNFSPGLEDYKKVVFIQELKGDIKPENAPAHITLEALYSKDVGLYTVVVYIFEH